LIDLASYRAMTHTNDAQTVHSCQTRSVCKPRPPAYIQGPASIRNQKPTVSCNNCAYHCLQLAFTPQHRTLLW